MRTTTKAEQPWCHGNLRQHGFFPAPLCGKVAKVEREGKWYCGVHDPVARKAKADANYQEFNAKSDRRVAIEKADRAIIAAAREWYRAIEAGDWLKSEKAQVALLDAVDALVALEAQGKEGA